MTFKDFCIVSASLCSSCGRGRADHECGAFADCGGADTLRDRLLRAVTDRSDRAPTVKGPPLPADYHVDLSFNAGASATQYLPIRWRPDMASAGSSSSEPGCVAAMRPRRCARRVIPNASC